MKKAFTLIEILVVIAIMGFLAAMVAPKLGGVLTASEDPIDEVNQRKLTKVLDDFISLKSRLPRGLINLVYDNNVTGILSTQLVINEEDTQTGEREFSRQFYKNLIPTLHHLSANEVKELKRLGIGQVRNYKYTYANNKNEYNKHHTLIEGDAVLMVGGGSVDKNTNLVWNSTEVSVEDDGIGDIHIKNDMNIPLVSPPANRYAYLANSKYIGRIIMGLDDDSELVKSGFVKSMGTSPLESRETRVRFLNYLVLLPRLQSTVSRMSEVEVDENKYDIEVEVKYGSNRKGLLVKEAVNKITILAPQGKGNEDREFIYGVEIK